jgi:hypothetical protein
MFLESGLLPHNHEAHSHTSRAVRTHKLDRMMAAEDHHGPVSCGR